MTVQPAIATDEKPASYDVNLPYSFWQSIVGSPKFPNIEKLCSEIEKELDNLEKHLVNRFNSDLKPDEQLLKDEKKRKAFVENYRLFSDQLKKLEKKVKEPESYCDSYITKNKQIAERCNAIMTKMAELKSLKTKLQSAFISVNFIPYKGGCLNKSLKVIVGTPLSIMKASYRFIANKTHSKVTAVALLSFGTYQIYKYFTEGSYPVIWQIAAVSVLGYSLHKVFYH